MADTTGIAWADATLNLWKGCTQLTAACDNCYAKTWGSRFGIEWNAPPIRTVLSTRKKLFSYQRKAAAFTAEHGHPMRIFINSLSDFFDNQADQAWRDEACIDFEACPDVIIMLVTKRPQNVRKMVPLHWLRPGGWPARVWVLTTGENQVEFDRRVIALMDVPAPIRGVSMEPMLEPIDAAWAFRRNASDITKRIWASLKGKRMPQHISALNWLIIGGESGSKARPMPPLGAVSDMAYRVRAEGGAVFMKQLSQADHPKTYGDFDTFPPGLKVREHPHD
jgi:protein gp37